METKSYFNNKQIEKQIKKYQKTKEKEIIEELTPVFNKLILGVISRYKLLRRNYINDDLYQEAWLGILESLPKWSKNKGDAFSYFTGVVRNKIFWYLKNQYKDTSFVSKDIQFINLDLYNTDYYSLEKQDDYNNDLILIKNYLNNLILSDLKLGFDANGRYKKILNIIKEKELCIDNLQNPELITEIQKETKIPKKTVKKVLTAIYFNIINYKEENNEQHIDM